MRSQIKAEPLLRLIFQTCNHYKKHYCFPSQLTLMRWLEAYYEIEISIATLNRWLRACEDLGFISRKRRIKRVRGQGMTFRSTMYFITMRGFHHLKRLGYNVIESFQRLYKWLNRGRKDGDKTTGADIHEGYNRSTFSASDRSKILPANT